MTTEAPVQGTQPEDVEFEIVGFLIPGLAAPRPNDMASWPFEIKRSRTDQFGTKLSAYRPSDWDCGYKAGDVVRATYKFSKPYFNERANKELQSRNVEFFSEATEADIGQQPTSNMAPAARTQPPPTDEAKRDIVLQPPVAMTIDDAEAIKRRSIERQIALKAAVELCISKGNEGVALEQANIFFAWLREDAADVKAPSSPAEPVSEPEGGATLEASDEPWKPPAESDGGPPLFPETRKLTNVGAFRQALADDFGLKNMPEIEAALEAASLNKFSQVGNFNDAIAALHLHRGESQ